MESLKISGDNKTINDGVVIYRWTELPGKRTDVIRLPKIRLQMAYVKDGTPRFISAVPVLMADGKAPFICLSSGPVYISIDPARAGKMIVGKRTQSELFTTAPVEYLYNGEAELSEWSYAIYRHMVDNAPTRVGMYNSPMWCRKARSRKDLVPRDNLMVRFELGIPQDAVISGKDLKIKWDNMAQNAGCIGYCDDGFLWESGMIKSGGVVCTPRQYNQAFSISGSCLKSDISHLIKAQKWRVSL